MGNTEKLWISALLSFKLIFLFCKIYKHPILFSSVFPQNLIASSLSSLKDKNAFEKTTTVESLPFSLYCLILSISILFIYEPL